MMGLFFQEAKFVLARKNLVLGYREIFLAVCICTGTFFFVVWQGIYDPGQTQEKDGTKGLFFYHSNPLCCLDQRLAVMELS